MHKTILAYSVFTSFLLFTSFSLAETRVSPSSIQRRRVAADSVTGLSVQTDESARARMDQGKVTAGSQSNDKQQVQLIADIRKAIVSDDSLSMRAHNVVIVSRGPSRVSLRGEVNSQTERDRVLALAKLHASSVDSEITIRP